MDRQVGILLSNKPRGELSQEIPPVTKATLSIKLKNSSVLGKLIFNNLIAFNKIEVNALVL